MSKKHLDTKMFKDICKNELKSNAIVKYICGEYDVDIEVKPYSTMQEKQTIAETVWACYGGKEYRVAAHCPVYRLMVLYTYCSNLKIELGRGIDAYYDLVMHTSLYNAVTAVIDKEDLSLLEDVVWEYTRHMEEYECASTLDKSLSSLLETLNEKLGSVNVDDLINDIQKVAKAAEDGNIVESVLDHYAANKPEDDINGNDNGRAEEADFGEAE